LLIYEGEIYHQLTRFRSDVQNQLVSLHPDFASETDGAHVRASLPALEFNYITHDAAMHRDLSTLFEGLDKGSLIWSEVMF
jgi:hypothetical protein